MTTNVIPEEQIKNLFNNLLVTVDSIENTMDKIYNVDLKLVANTMFSTTFIFGAGERNIGNRSNIDMLQQNKDQNLQLLKAIKTKIDESIKATTPTTPEQIKEICDMYTQIESRIRNDEEASKKIAESINKNIFQIQEFINKLEPLSNKCGVSSSKLRTKIEKDITEAIDKLKDQNLNNAKASYYFYYNLIEVIKKYNGNDTTNKNKRDEINSNYKEMVAKGFDVIAANIKENNDPAEIETYAKNAVVGLQTLYKF